MSRFWPHPQYAEDQPYAHPILYTHVATRAFQTGALAGFLVGDVGLPIANRILGRRPATASPSPIFSSRLLFPKTGVGAVVGTALLTLGVPMRMYGRDEIEWRDRSWRLLENKSQVAVDDWTYLGMLVGAATSVGKRNLGWRVVVGRIGVGSLLGMGGGVFAGK